MDNNTSNLILDYELDKILPHYRAKHGDNIVYSLRVDDNNTMQIVGYTVEESSNKREVFSDHEIFLKYKGDCLYRINSQDLNGHSINRLFTLCCPVGTYSTISKLNPTTEIKF